MPDDTRRKMKEDILIVGSQEKKRILYEQRIKFRALASEESEDHLGIPTGGTMFPSMTKSCSSSHKSPCTRKNCCRMNSRPKIR